MSVAGIPLAIPSEERLRLYCSLLMDDTPVVNCATADDCLDTLGDVNSLGGWDRMSLSCCREWRIVHPCRSSFRGNKIQAELDRSTINLRRVAGRRASSGANGFPPRSTSREACLLCILHCVAHVIGGSHRQNVKTPVWQRWRRRRLAWRVAISLHPRREESHHAGDKRA